MATVGSLVRCHVVIQDPPTAIFIHEFRLTAIQNQSVRSSKDPSQSHASTPLSYVLTFLEGTISRDRCIVNPDSAILDERAQKNYVKQPLIRIEKGQRFTMTTTDRFPRCEMFRPSSLPGSTSPIQISNAFEVAIVYATADEPSSLRQVKHSVPVMIHSVCRKCFSLAITLTSICAFSVPCVSVP